MISIRLDGHDLVEPLKEILRLFTATPAHVTSEPDGGILLCAEGPDVRIASVLRTAPAGHLAVTRDLDSGLAREAFVPDSGSGPSGAHLPVPVRRQLKRQLFFLLSERTGMHPPWGSLTGIRPTVVATEYLDAGLRDDEAALALERDYGVTRSKAVLAVRTARAEALVLDGFPATDAGVYVSIPFCTTRSGYCSFPSDTFERVKGRMPEYLSALLAEADWIGAGLDAEGRKAACLYVGGGSPAVLSALQIEALLQGLRRRIPFREHAETTFEAGRCDDLDVEKIHACARGGVDRLCLNPQSTDPVTLARIGRPAAGSLLAEWSREARRAGIARLSMDLIAGLPGESETSFLRSLDDVLALAPDNVTVHALSRKRRAPLTQEAPAPADDGAAAGMVDAAHARLDAAGYEPYYLYRQKDTVGGLENVGFSLPGGACRYNVAMMSDRRAILGIGAGATSKRLVPGSSRIERCIAPLDVRTFLAAIAPTRPEG